MIVSHRHRFIFFAVPRTATHAVRTALAPELGPDDWQQQALFEDRRLPIPALAARRHGHLSVQDVMGHLDETAWRDYCKFAFVRNPFDRFVSAAFMLFRGDPTFGPNATDRLKAALDRPRFRQRVLIRPQAEQLADASGAIAMDVLGRYETLDRDFAAICRRLGLPAVNLERRNRTTHDRYQRYYDDELRERVAAFYAADIAAFGYRFDSAAGSRN